MFNPNQFYELSEPETRRFPRVPRPLYLIVVAIFTFATVIATIIGGTILNTISNVLLTGSQTAGTSAFATAKQLGVSFTVMILIVYVALYLFERRSFASVGMQRGNVVRNYLRGSGVGLIFMSAIMLILWLLGAVTLENPISAASVAGAFVVLLGFVIQGAAEEILFRGFLLQIFGRMTNTPIAILVSSAIFAFAHSLVPGIDNLSKFNVFLIGVFLAVYVLYEGGLWGAFGIHTFYNWSQGNLFGINFSAVSNQSATVFDLVRTGPEIIAGGSFGLEGGVVVTIVTLAGLVLLFLFGKRLQTPTNTINATHAQEPTNRTQNANSKLQKVTRWLVGTVIVGLVLVVLALTGLTNWFPFTSFEVRGDQLWLNGMMNGHTVRQFTNMLEENPNITTLVLEDVPGSSQDEAITKIAHMIRENDIGTHLASHSVVTSGGSWLFIAGSERTMERGAEINVHSWGDLAKEAHEYPRDAPEHEELRAYVVDMLGSDDWYWFSINAADYAGEHLMSEAEVLEYRLLTQPIME